MVYRGANIRLLGNPRWWDIKPVLEKLRAEGANAVAFNVIHYCYIEPGTTNIAYLPKELRTHNLIYREAAQDPNRPFRDTPSLGTVSGAVRLAKEAGFERIILKPMIDSRYAEWRGFITVPNHLVPDFAYSYIHSLLGPYLPILRRQGCDLCMGTELVSITKNPRLGPAFWQEVALWLRKQGITNRLTYAANWGWHNPPDDNEYRRLMDLWPLLDYAGIDMYAPMLNEGDTRVPTVEQLLDTEATDNIGWYRTLQGAEHWMTPLAYDVVAFKHEISVPLWFTEIGYGATHQAALDPAGDTEAGELVPQPQENLVRAARQVWAGILEGIMWWEAGLGKTDGSTHDLLGTDAGKIAWGAV